MSGVTDRSEAGEHSTFSALLHELAHFSDREWRDAPPFQLGDVLRDRYLLEREIGRGGMGIVYEAYDRVLNTRCALKTLRAVGAERVVMLKNEFRSIARIHHANLVRPGELCEYEESWFYTMELVDGLHPIEWTAGDPARIRTVVLELADVLATIHAHGVVHRDVKPANVISSDQRTVLLDLGLARDTHRPMWFDRDDVGTTRYMAPELFVGGSATAASDMYSLGMLLTDLAGERGPSDLDTLARELRSADPSRRPTAAELVRRLGGKRSPACVAAPMFVGRTIELQRLERAFDRACMGSFATAFVHGASGMGKTALVEHFVRGCTEALVLVGRCYESETVAFKAIDDIVDAIAASVAQRPDIELPPDVAELCHVFPSFAAVIPGASASRAAGTSDVIHTLATSLHVALAVLAQVTPVVVVIDDLQWIDNDGLRVLAHLLALAPRRCFVIATSRARERPEPLGTLQCSVAIQLQPLSAQDAAHLARTIAPVSDDRVSEIVDAGQGQPYTICELALRETEIRAPLSPDSRRILELVAVAGAPYPAHVFAVAADLSLAALEDGLRDLQQRRLVRWRGVGAAATVEPFHDRVREELGRDLSRTAALVAHGALADALVVAMPSARAWIASHLSRAGRRVEAAAHALEGAARACENGAFANAADLLALALESGVDDPQAVREQLAEMRMRAWQPLAAAAAFRAAAETAPPERARALLVRAAEQTLIGGDLAQGLDDLAAILRGAGVRVPRRRWSALATMLIRRAELRFRHVRIFRGRRPSADEIDLLGWASSTVMMIDAPLALGYHTRALLAILELDDPVRLARSLSTEACIQAATASLSEAERMIRQIEEICAEHEAAQGAQRPPKMVLGVQRGAWHDVIETGSRPGPTITAWHNASRELYLAHCEFNLGRFADLERRCDRGLHSAAERGDRWLELVTSVSFAPMVALVHDDVQRARAIIERGRELLWRGGRGGYLHALSACAARFADLYVGDHEGALAAWVGPGSDTIARKSHYGLVYLEFLGATAALGAMHRSGSSHQLRTRVRGAIRQLSRSPIPWAAPYAALLAAQLDPERRAAHLVAAREGFARFDIEHMVDVVDRVLEPAGSAAMRLEERGVVRVDRFVAMFVPETRS